MSGFSEAPQGRRERNKQQKLARITAAATALFAERGIDEVTTQEVADAADIGTGTLFLYAKNKGELLLLVQNALYIEALDRGEAAASVARSPLDSVMAYIRPIIECNRKHIANGRTYLREMVFGDPTEPHHAAAREIATDTESRIAAALRSYEGFDAHRAAAVAQITSAVMLLTLGAGAAATPSGSSDAAPSDAALSDAEVTAHIEHQLAVVLSDAAQAGPH